MFIDRSTVCRLIPAVLASVMAPAGIGATTEEIIDSCEHCHGEGGASEHGAIPVIGGMSAFYLEEQLRAYQNDSRPCQEVEYPAGPKKGELDDMCEEVEGLDDDQIADIALYFDEQPFVVPDQKVDGALAAKGEEIHDSKCSKCHSEGGGLSWDDAGILAGQWRPYLEATFEQYMSGERWQPEKMKPKMDELSESDVDALIEFYVSQEPVDE